MVTDAISLGYAFGNANACVRRYKSYVAYGIHITRLLLYASCFIQQATLGQDNIRVLRDSD